MKWASTQYRPEIDGIRALAVLGVIAFHAFPHSLTGGFTGVDVFFVISGFLITSQILSDLDRKKFSLLNFYKRRINRLLPAVLIILMPTILLAWFLLLPDEFAKFGLSLFGASTFSVNFIFSSEVGYFDTQAETKPLLHLWSLAVEEQFYLIWPIFLIFIIGSKLNPLTTMVVIGVFSFSHGYFFPVIEAKESFYLPQARFWELIIGGGLAFSQIRYGEKLEKLLAFCNQLLMRVVFTRPKYPDYRVIDDVILVCGLTLVSFGFFSLQPRGLYPSSLTLIPVIGTALIIFAGQNAVFFKPLLANKIAVGIGLISYPLYLWHWPILSLLFIVKGETPHRDAKLGALLISFALAFVTYRFFEQPIRRKNSKVLATILLGILLVLGAVGGYIYSNDGLESRKFVQTYLNNQGQLIRTKHVDEGCEEFFQLPPNSRAFEYCRFSKSQGNRKVLIIGDSHAHAAYEGFADGSRELGIETALMANSSCPPFINLPTGRTKPKLENCYARIKQIYWAVNSYKPQVVYFFSRGPTYWTGINIPGGKPQPASLDIDSYFLGLENTARHIANLGIDFVYVSENPEFKLSPKSCLPRPLNSGVKEKCEISISDFRARQNTYLAKLGAYENQFTVLYSWKAFCSEVGCSMFSQNDELLYADDDHLSVIGSQIQFREIILKDLKTRFQ